MRYLNSTLEELVESVNLDLSTLVGSVVKNPYDVCHKIRDVIKGNDFYKSLEENGLQDLLVFSDDIAEMRYVYIRGSKKDSNLKKIIEMRFNINFFDDTNIGLGGTITDVSCTLVGEGITFKTMPISMVVSGLKLVETQAELEDINKDIQELTDSLKEKTNKKKELEAEEERLKKLLGIG